MSNSNKNRSGSQSNRNGKNENMGDHGRQHLPGSTPESNNTYSKQEEIGKQYKEEAKHGTKKGPNSI
jgi:hypothetical protein